MEHELRQNIYYELRWNILPCNNLKQEILRNKKNNKKNKCYLLPRWYVWYSNDQIQRNEPTF